jgi:hypothetical protein
MNQQLLDICLKITGSFENGSPDYTSVTGNFDGQGLSVGILQWCAGQGSLGVLLGRIAQLGGDLGELSQLPLMNTSQAKQFVMQNYLNPQGEPTPQAQQRWAALLGSEAGVQAQVQLAIEGPLGKAASLAQRFCPDAPEHPRVVAFFFDLVTQSGGMSNHKGSVAPVPPDVDASEALGYAQTKPKFYSQLSRGLDPLANHLLYYALERAKLSKPEYVWDSFSRRATIAARHGIVHGIVFDFSDVLP